MGRIKKRGMDYFPLDCKPDNRIDMLEDVHGSVGFCIYIKLLQFMYSSEQIELDLSNGLQIQALAKRSFVAHSKYMKVIRTCVEVGLFNKEKFKENILFSEEVNYRYKSVAKERDRALTKYRNTSAEKNRSIPENPGNTYGKETKLKKTKVKETTSSSLAEEQQQAQEQNILKIKEPEIQAAPAAVPADDYSRPLHIRVKPFESQYGKPMIDAFLRYWTERTQDGRLERWQMERVFEPDVRLKIWQSKSKTNNPNATPGFVFGGPTPR